MRAMFIIPIVLLFALLVIAIPIYILVQSSKKLNQEYEQQKQNINNSPNQSLPQDAPSLGLTIVGFLLPLIGLIMYIAWLSTLPFRARSAGRGALMGVIFPICCATIYSIVGFVIYSVVGRL